MIGESIAVRIDFGRGIVSQNAAKVGVFPQVGDPIFIGIGELVAAVNHQRVGAHTVRHRRGGEVMLHGRPSDYVLAGNRIGHIEPAAGSDNRREVGGPSDIECGLRQIVGDGERRRLILS